MMNEILRSPTGFFRVSGSDNINAPLSKDSIAKPNHCQEIEALYDAVQKGLVDTQNFNYKMMVVDIAVRTFKNFNHWLALNAVSSEYIYDLNWKLVEDTVQFIRNGKRTLSFHTARSLILTHPEAQRGVATPRRLSALKLQPKEFDDAVAMWCAREDGVNDLLKTMYLFFGNVGDAGVAPNPKN